MRTVPTAVAAAAVLLTLTIQPATGTAGVPGTVVSADRTEISFDSGTAPCLFDDTQPLTDEYASVGVHFTGPYAGAGGAILNQCGGFGIRARSGKEFLAFNVDLTYGKTPETITFDRPATRVAAFVANGDVGLATYHLVGKLDGKVVARTVVTARTQAYTGIAVRAARGIDTVVFEATTSDGMFVLDDLSFRPKD